MSNTITLDINEMESLINSIGSASFITENYSVFITMLVEIFYFFKNEKYENQSAIFTEQILFEILSGKIKKYPNIKEEIAYVFNKEDAESFIFKMTEKDVRKSLMKSLSDSSITDFKRNHYSEIYKLLNILDFKLFSVFQYFLRSVHYL